MRSVCMTKSVPIRVKKEIREILKKSKKYPRETYSDAIKRIIKREGKLNGR